MFKKISKRAIRNSMAGVVIGITCAGVQKRPSPRCTTLACRLLWANGKWQPGGSREMIMPPLTS